jgi:hypothetical protein
MLLYLLDKLAQSLPLSPSLHHHLRLVTEVRKYQHNNSTFLRRALSILEISAKHQNHSGSTNWLIAIFAEGDPRSFCFLES